MSDDVYELVVAAGDPQGIGPEVAVKAASSFHAAADGGDPAAAARVRIVLAGDPTAWRAAGAAAHWPRISGGEPSSAPIAILPVDAAPGAAPAPSAAGGRAALVALDAAVARVLAAPERRALVTAPLGKEAVRMAGFERFDGHTGYLAAKVGARKPLMLFSAPGFRVALATVHVPLRKVAELVTAEALAETLRELSYELRRRYGIAAPRIDVLGLNPHAGEGGAFGDEERTALEPAVARLRSEGEDVRGPFPADSYFLEGFGARADCVVAMYHDQGLVAVKSLAFTAAVNVTLGLPFVRTSPDHGTAYGIAGRGIADARPMRRALDEAFGLLRSTAPGRMGDVRRVP